MKTKSKYLAVFSLLIMAIGFLITLWLPETTAVFILKGGFEAGLVGGIADWFAVTALFRHPLGIPIPHTSLLLKNKEKITRSLISAMENDLLNKASIKDKLRHFRIMEAASAMLTRLLRRRTVRESILDFLIRQLRELPVEPLVPAVKRIMGQWVGSLDLKEKSDKLLTQAIQSGYDQKAFDFAVRSALEWLTRPGTRTMLGKLANEKLSEVKVGGFFGFAFQAFAGFMDEEKLGFVLQDMLHSTVLNLLKPDNPNRDKILQELRVQLFQLTDDEERLAKVKEWLTERVEGEFGSEFLGARLEELRQLAIAMLEKEKERGARRLISVYFAVRKGVRRDPEGIAAVENRMLEYLVELIEANHYRIGELVRENVDRMDDATLISMIEDRLGSDLQWIRVNGAICGFLVGLILTVIQL